VKERQLQFFLESLMAVQADLSLRPGFQTELVLAWDEAIATVETITRITRTVLVRSVMIYPCHRFAARWQSSQDRPPKGRELFP